MMQNKQPFPAWEDKSNSLSKDKRQLIDERELSLGDFLQQTTFHGIKYIFIDTPFRARRVLWCLAVISAIIFFTYQLGNRLQVYYEYQSTVSVEMKFTDSVDLPAVTICNQNSYRTTVVVEKGMYGAINELYEAHNTSAVNISKLNLENITDVEQFVRETAHQLEDFIDSCTWYGDPCDLDQDFEVTLTDIGVCYTFNSSRTYGRLKVTEPGSQNGLQLILNVEHYEYMRGPQADVGVKVLLHEPGEVPMMKDKGFAAAPGTHTLVAVKRSEIHYLPPPYSTCIENGLPASNCFRQCHTEIIQRHCGCRDVYMPEIDSGVQPICNFTTKFQCADAPKKVIRQEMQACYQCQTPCKRVTFEPRLSYGQLSRFNIDRLVLSDPKKENLVQEQFYKATESSQRVIEAIALEDKKHMDHIMEIFIELGQQVMSLKHEFRDFSSFANSLNYPDILMRAGDFSEEDSDIFKERKREFYNVKWQSWYMEWYSYYIYDFIKLSKDYLNSGGKGNIPLTTDLEFCLNLTANSMTDNKTENATDLAENADDLKHCNIIANKTREYFNCTKNGRSFVSTNVLPRLMNITQQLHAGLMQLFDNSSFSFDKFPGYEECSQHLNMTLEMTNETFYEILAIIDGIVRSNNTESVLSQVTELSVHVSFFFDDVMKEWELKHANQYEFQCDSRFYYGYGDVKFPNCTVFLENMVMEEEWSNILDAFSLVKQTMFDTKTNFLKVAESMAILCDIHNHTLSPVLKAIYDYQRKAITKLKLAYIFESTQALRAWTQVTSLSSALKTSTEEFVTNMDKIKAGLTEAYEQVFAFPYPILANDNFTQLLLLKEISRTSKPSLLQDILDVNNSLRLNIIQETIDNLFADYEHQMELRATNVTGLADRLVKEVDKFNERLDEFQLESKIDSRFYMENFLRLDIYYRDLSYQLVQQVPSFDLQGLLSQVGGFLGLLLGASILTVCELLDYLGLRLMKGWHKGKATAPVKY